MSEEESGSWIPAFHKQYDEAHGTYQWHNIYEVDEDLWAYADALQAESKRRKRMTPEEYTQAVMRTCAIKPTDYREMLKMGALGLAGEAGEVADIVKKHVYHGHGLDKTELAKELGDVLWYLTLLAKSQHYDLGEVMERNIAKLRKRYPEGFESEKSINRQE